MALRDWQNIFNAISDCVLILDPEGRILNSNGVFESMRGTKTETIIGQHCYNIMNCTSGVIKDDPFERMKQNMMRESFEFEDRGRRARFQVTMDPVFRESGEIMKAILIIRNLTGSTKSEKTRLDTIQF